MQGLVKVAALLHSFEIKLACKILSITEEIPYRVTLHHAEGIDPSIRQSEAYVDDTSFMINAYDLDLNDPRTNVLNLGHRITKVAE